MKIFGIIAEFNPFHNGHARLLEFCRANGADMIFCAMSGNFTQRGEPAVFDKYSRAKHAVLAGADLVAEIPTIFSVAAAENFALGGVRLLSQMGCTHICFGSENGNIEELMMAANFTSSQEYSTILKKYLCKGFSYSQSSELVLSEKFGDNIIGSNNVLAIEYLKAIEKTNCDISPLTLSRNTPYAEHELKGKIVSAATIRSFLKKHSGKIRNNHKIKRCVPPFVYEDLKKTKANLFEKYYNYAHAYISTCSKGYLSQIEGVTEGLENRIFDAANQKNYDNFFNTLKTKRYSDARFQRIIFNCLLNISKETIENVKKSHFSPTLLAAKKDGKALKFLAENNLLYDTDVDIMIEEKDMAAEKLYCALSNSTFDTIRKLKKY